MRNSVKHSQVFDNRIPAMWTISDVMQLTKYSRQTIYNKISQKVIPEDCLVFKESKKGTVRFFPDKILDWWLGGRN